MKTVKFRAFLRHNSISLRTIFSLNGYSFKDLIELDPEIFVTIQASAGRTDNVEFTLSPAALKKNNIPYYGTTQKAEKIDLRAGCLLPNKAELKANDAWNVTPGKPQGIKADPSYIAKEPVKYYPTEGGDTSSETSSETSSDTSSGGKHRRNLKLIHLPLKEN